MVEDLLLSLQPQRYDMNDTIAGATAGPEEAMELGLKVRTEKKASNEIPEEGSLAPRRGVLRKAARLAI